MLALEYAVSKSSAASDSELVFVMIFLITVLRCSGSVLWSQCPRNTDNTSHGQVWFAITAHEQSIISVELFVGNKVASQPIHKKQEISRMFTV